MTVIEALHGATAVCAQSMKKGVAEVDQVGGR